MAARGNGATTENRSRRVVFSLRLIASMTAAALVALTAIVLSGVNEKSMQATLEQEAQTQLLLDARNLALSSSVGLLSEFPELTLVPLAKEFVKDRPEILIVTIVDHEGIIQGHPDSRQVGKDWKRPDSLNHLNTTALLPGEKLGYSPGLILVESPIHYGRESNLGWAVLGLDRQFIQAKIKANRTKMLTISFALMAAAIVLAMVFMSLLFRPISRLREGLERIGQGDLDHPMQLKDLTELGMLGRTVNEMAGQLKASRKLAQAREQEVIDTQKEVIITLGQVVENRSSETANHTIRVGDMSYELALLYGLSEEEAEMIRAASPMHDVGKIGIPDSILNKAGKLSPEEYRRMQDHPTIGFTILDKSDRPLMKAAAIIALEHHERWDGQGYPRQIKGEDIHIYGRIVALADVFDALFSNRVYRQAMPLEKALGIISEGRGTHFDPRLVDLFKANLNRFLAISEKYADDVKVDPFDPSLAETPAKTVPS